MKCVDCGKEYDEDDAIIEYSNSDVSGRIIGWRCKVCDVDDKPNMN